MENNEKNVQAPAIEEIDIDQVEHVLGGLSIVDLQRSISRSVLRSPILRLPPRDLAAGNVAWQ